MHILYYPPQPSVKTMKEAIKAFEDRGYNTDHMRIGLLWEDFLRETPDGTTVVVYSVDFFPSLMELLSTLAQLQERGISLKSLQEPWLSGQIDSTTDFLVKLGDLAVLLHTNRTRAGLAKARSEGKKLGRPVGWRKDRTRGRG